MAAIRPPGHPNTTTAGARNAWRSAGCPVQAATPPESRMSYRVPVADMVFSLRHAAGFGAAVAEGLYGDLGEDVVDAVLAEAGRFASEVLSPLNRVGDRCGAQFKNGAVT